MHTKIVDLQIQAYNEQDLEKFILYYHPDIMITDMSNGKLIVQGKDQLISVYQNLFKTHPNNRATVKNRIVLNNIIADEEHISGRETHPEGLSALVIYQFKDSLISRVSIF